MCAGISLLLLSKPKLLLFSQKYIYCFRHLGVSVLGQQMCQELGLAPLWHGGSSSARAGVVPSQPCEPCQCHGRGVRLRKVPEHRGSALGAPASPELLQPRFQPAHVSELSAIDTSLACLQLSLSLA